MVVKLFFNYQERLYQRLANAAQATQRPLEAVILHALEVGSPPDWDDVPEAFARRFSRTLCNWTTLPCGRSHACRNSTANITRYDELLDRNQSETLTDAEQLELATLRHQADRFMLCKAQDTATTNNLLISLADSLTSLLSSCSLTFLSYRESTTDNLFISMLNLASLIVLTAIILY